MLKEEINTHHELDGTLNSTTYLRLLSAATDSQTFQTTASSLKVKFLLDAALILKLFI